MNQSAENSNPPKTFELEIKDAHVIFDTVWESLEEEVGHENLRFPKELILLGGAPGSGKGTHTRFIMQSRGLTCPPIIISQLLTTPEATRIKDMGQMVGDTEVIGILFRELLKEKYRDGALLDGFPRTRVQVECLKMLVDQIDQLNNEYADTEWAIHFRRPIIHAMVLFASEQTSIERQLFRGKQIAEHNRKVEETGVGELQELRGTDLEHVKAAQRYRVFKEKTWDALRSLKEIYHYHFINAEGPIDEVESNILKELQYQSSLELDPKTFDHLSPLPLAEEITIHARQELVKRLDSYVLSHTELFTEIIEIIDSKFMPIVTRHALSGRANVNSEDRIFENPMAISMLIDIFSERGFHAMVDKRIQEVPESVDLNSGKISCRQKIVFRIQIHFEGSSIRRG
ncbi:MAG: nucleoside monophosphate kinase [Mariniblastus sp.]|nr:nucleoside monophosphate kinase [Planctomycetaceae bacterium]MCP4477699.1 nucleoside monophosphate kinase [Planctomycetaceae bacterium]MDG1513970.1 nucleoside monophosphate kinase [Mariniblastus sp.]MDG2183033.1 nucleoside monophosphate kinase [Mariniblastus sp.]